MDRRLRLKLSLVFVFWLSPQFATSQLIVPSFDSIRRGEVGDPSNVPPVGQVVPVKYRKETGPGANPPRQTPHLRDNQVSELLLQMRSLDAALHSPETLTEKQLWRLRLGLASIDIYYVDPIPTQRWDKILEIMSNVAKTEYLKSNDWDTTIDKMLSEGLRTLRDPHSDYWDRNQYKNFKNDLQGSYAGIGATLEKTSVPEGIQVKNTFPNSGARLAGIQPGDIITEADGVSVAGMPVDEAIKKIRGPENSRVDIRVIRNNRKMPLMQVARTRIQIPNVLSKMVADKIGYIYLNSFNDGSYEEVLENIYRLRAQGAQSMILDVRSNSGGFVKAVSSIASEFLLNGQPIVSFKHQGLLDFKTITDGDGRFSNMPIVVLINEYSASASEILAGAFQDLRLGYTVIGSRSYGKGSEQVVMNQGDGRALHITENKWYTPNGRNIDAKHDPEDGREIAGTGGIQPDLVVDVLEEQRNKIMQELFDELFQIPVSQPRTPDPVLEKAIGVLSGSNAS